MYYSTGSFHSAFATIAAGCATGSWRAGCTSEGGKEPKLEPCIQIQIDQTWPQAKKKSLLLLFVLTGCCECRLIVVLFCALAARVLLDFISGLGIDEGAPPYAPPPLPVLPPLNSRLATYGFEFSARLKFVLMILA